MLTKKNETRNLTIIWVLSIIIPLAIALLLFIPSKSGVHASWVFLLPHLNAVLNSTTAVLLLIGFVFIKKKQITYHKTCMLIAFTLGCVFLVSYIIYHSSAPSTVFGDINGDGVLDATEKAALGSMRAVYLIILLSHILLAIVVVPFVLLSLFYALSRKFDKHKKIVHYTLPIWLYVSISGVIVYLMISPYY